VSEIRVELPDEALDALADRMADLLASRLPTPAASDGYLRPEAAACYIGASGPKRIYDLKSMGELEPDGFDGRIPLFGRATLDDYVRGTRRPPTAA